MSTHRHPASTGPEPAFPAGAPYQAVALASPRAPTARLNVPAARQTPPRRAVPTSVLEGDRLVRLLATLRSVLVVHLAHAAAALAAHEAWHLHCFRTRTDFARERLHRDPRWLGDMVRLHEALEKFPSLRPALCSDDGGRPLGQVAVLQIARVATQEDVDIWIDRARRLPLDELRAAVKTQVRRLAGDVSRDTSHAPAMDPAAHDAPQLVDESAANDSEDAPQVTLRQSMPPDVKWAFDAALDLHRSIEGGETSATRFVEALVGEAASSACLPPNDFCPRFAPRATASHAHGPRHVSRSQTGVPAERAQSPAGVPSRSAWPQAPMTDDGPSSHPGTTAHGTDESAGPMVLALHTPAIRRAIQRLATFERLRERLARLDRKLQLAAGERGSDVHARNSDAIAPSRVHARRSVRGLHSHRRDVRRIARILEHLLRLEDGLEIDIGDLLLELHEHEAWRILGFSGLEAYATARLRLAGSTARRRVAVARELRRLPAVRQAYERGELGIMRAQWVSRGLRGKRAKPETLHTWITHARAHTIKRLHHEERRLESQRLLAQIAVARAMTPGRKSRAAAQETSLPNAQTNPAMLSAAQTAQRSPLDPLPMDDTGWRASLRRVPGETRAQVIDLGYGLLERLVHGGPLTHASLCVRLSESAAVDLLGCIEAARRGLAALAATPSAPADGSLLPPSARMARDFVDHGRRVPEWVGLLALLEEWAWVHDDPRSTPRRPERRVLERDGYRCMAPGCTSRARLHVHHLVYRAHLGGNDTPNLLVLCAYHHLQGEHGGLARARGRAPLDVDWRLGCDEFATFYRNERQLDADPFRASA